MNSVVRRASERERLSIEALYSEIVTGDLEKARQTYELSAQTFPRAVSPKNQLGNVDVELGQYDEGVIEYREGLRIEKDPVIYSNLVSAYLCLNRYKEAKAAIDEAQARKFDSPSLRYLLYSLAFLDGDSGMMTQQVAWSPGKPGVEDVFLYMEAESGAYSGRLAKAQELSRRAVDSAERAGEKETASSYEAEAALREALFGNSAAAQRRVNAALGLSNGRDVQYLAALTLAVTGEAARAQELAADLSKRFPEDTIVQFNYLPAIQAQVALSHNDSSKAIETLQAAAPYELGLESSGAFVVALHPAFVRGAAYLAGHHGIEAAAEFQKILDRRGLVSNEPIGAVAHLHLGRAYTLQGDTAKARAAYQDFLTLWKDADADIPILKEAKAEYAKLQ